MTISDHLAQIRALVGTTILALPSVAAVVRDHEGGVLVLRHADSGRWVLPGGAVEPLEEPADALVREVWEETGVHVAPTSVLGVQGGVDHHIRYRNGDEVSYLCVVFGCRWLSGSPRPDGEEAKEVAFVGVDDLADLPLAPWMRTLVEPVLLDPPDTSWFAPPAWRPQDG